MWLRDYQIVSRVELKTIEGEPTNCIGRQWIKILSKWQNIATNIHVCLGWMYRMGLGVDENYTTAVIWYYKAAEQGYATAQNNFELMYRIGLGVDENYSTAVISYRKASEQGYATFLD